MIADPYRHTQALPKGTVSTLAIHSYSVSILNEKKKKKKKRERERERDGERLDRFEKILQSGEPLKWRLGNRIYYYCLSAHTHNMRIPTFHSLFNTVHSPVEMEGEFAY